MRHEKFDPFDYLEESATYRWLPSTEATRAIARERAKSARDERWRQLKAAGKDVSRSVLKSQLEKYQAFGVDGRGYRDVFYINIHEEI